MRLLDDNAKKAYMIMLFDGLAVSSGSVVLPLLREQYGLTYNLAGALLAMLSVGNLAAGLLCAALPGRIGQRNTALLLTSGLCLGYAMMLLSGAPALLLTAFLVLGFGKGSTMNNGTVAAGEIVKDKTSCTNMINALFATGSLLAPLVYIAASGHGLWQLPVIVLSLCGAVVWLLFYSMSLSRDRKTAAQDNDLSFLKTKHFRYAVAFMFFQQCTEISVTGWLVTYFKDRGILSGIFSELTVTVVWLAMLVGRLLIVFVLPERSRLRSLTFMSAASLITYILLMVSKQGWMAICFLFLFGLVESGCYPTGIACAGRKLSNALMGILLPAAGIGAIVMPYVVGAVADRFGIFMGMLCPGATIIGMIVFAVLMEKKR